MKLTAGYTTNGFYALSRSIADLIDRPTCSMSDVGDDTEQTYRCSVCGEEYFMSDVKPYPWRFCPVCGARLSLVKDERGGVTGAVRESEYTCKACGR